MRTRFAVALVALVLVAASCVSESRTTRTIAVGMDWSVAADSLRAAGATKTDMAITSGRTSEPTGGAYQLRGGSVLVINCTECTDSKVTSLEVCRNADAPKAMRTWEKVDQLVVDDPAVPR